MRVIHRIALWLDPEKHKKLVGLGIDCGQDEYAFVGFNAAESDPAWPALEALLSAWGLGSGIVWTEFSDIELASAGHLQMGCNRHHGYPMPDDDFGYLKLTYDLRGYCAECGVGVRQKASLRMRGEPKWGRKHVFRLHWVYDEYFVLPDVWRDVFKPFGIRCQPVVKHRTGEELKTVVQLEIGAVASVALNVEGLRSEICPECGRKKYWPVSRGLFPSFTARPEGDIFKTQEYFGSGGSAHKAVIVSARMFRAIRENGLKGVTFTPVGKPEPAWLGRGTSR